MTDTIEAATPDAEEAIQEVVTTALPTLDEIRQQRADKLKAQVEGESPKPEDEPEEEEAEESEEAEEEELEEESEESTEEATVLSKDYFDSLSEDDKEEILDELKPSTGAAFGKYRKQIRELKQELDILTKLDKGD